MICILIWEDLVCKQGYLMSLNSALEEKVWVDMAEVCQGKAVLVGFGVSTPEQVRKISRLGDGVIVGSALIDKIRRSRGRLGPVFKFVESLARPLQK